jgi:hypothetical protein
LPTVKPGFEPRPFRSLNLGPNGVPTNSTPIPGNNPNIPNPNTCIKFTERESQMEIKFWNDVLIQGDLTHNKKCRYAYVIPQNPNSRASLYARFVSNSPDEFALINISTGEHQIYDGATPGTNQLWEAKSTLDNQVSRLRDIYNRGKANISSLTSRSEIRTYNKLTQGNPQQAVKSLKLAQECGFAFKYAVNSRSFKRFVDREVVEFPSTVKIIHKPLPGLELIP